MYCDEKVLSRLLYVQQVVDLRFISVPCREKNGRYYLVSLPVAVEMEVGIELLISIYRLPWEYPYEKPLLSLRFNGFAKHKHLLKKFASIY